MYGTSVSVGIRCNIARHFTQVHSNFAWDFPVGSSLRIEKVSELRATLKKQQFIFTKLTKKVKAATEALFKVAHVV